MADDYADDDKAKGSGDDAILERARKEYKLCQDADINRADAIDDLNFLKGGENQWDAVAIARRKADGRPIITINSLPTYLHQVTNDQRQNTPSIKVHPAGDGADVETAKVRQGLIRHIEYDSNADIAYDRAVNSAAAIGFGYWRLITDYESETSFDQKIMFKSIRNALSVKLDPLGIEPDGSDINFAFIESLMSRPDFKSEYPKANACNTSLTGDATYASWLTDATVLVCDYYCIEKTQEDVVLLSNGETGFKKDLVSLPDGVTIQKTRKGERRKVMLYKITGVDILERTEIKCKWIPVFPVYGDEIDIEGKVTRAGIIRNAKGPKQAENVMMSGATEEIALRSKAPYIAVEGSFAGHEDEWNQANSRAFPYLEHAPVDVNGNLAPAPQRQPMADIPAGMLAMAMHAADNVKKTTGLFDASLGARGTATSGKQELAQQREGDMANFHYSDGLNRTVLHCGRCINSMIRYYYDAPRVVKILGEDDSVDYADINQVQRQEVQGEDGQMQAIHTVLNDMTAGEFDITVSAGPSYSTMRQENAEFFGNAMGAAKDPVTAAVLTYLAMKNQDIPGGEEATDMLKKLLPPGIAPPDKGKEAPPMVPTPQGPVPIEQAGQIIGQLGMQLEQASQAVQKAQGDKQASEVLRQQNEQAALQLDAERVKIEQFNAETERERMMQDAATEQQRQVADAEKYRAEQMKAQSEAMRTAEDARQKEHDDALRQADKEANSEPDVSLEDMAQLIIKSRPSIAGMTIKAPSGGVYDVRVNETLQ